MKTSSTFPLRSILLHFMVHRYRHLVDRCEYYCWVCKMKKAMLTRTTCGTGLFPLEADSGLENDEPSILASMDCSRNSVLSSLVTTLRSNSFNSAVSDRVMEGLALLSSVLLPRSLVLPLSPFPCSEVDACPLLGTPIAS